MADVFSKVKRSDIMSKIRGWGNKNTELVLVKLFRQHHITGWRRHQKIFGKPDFAFRRERVVVFVDGCFWHGCAKHCKVPTGNREFWQKKLSANKARDRRVNRELRKQGWNVIRLWQHDLVRQPERCILKIERALRDA